MNRSGSNLLAALAAALLVLLVGCSSSTPTTEEAPSPTAEATSPSEPAQPDQPDADAAEPDARTEAEIEPQPFIPAGPVGGADAYNELVSRLEDDVPPELRGQVPWPDLRNPNPIITQIEIFELWIWMAENHPEPRLVEMMAAPDSPSRSTIVGIFGSIQADNAFEVRTGGGYQAFDHRVVTFESAGLPLWLGRDVPEDAVVVYYTDQSGPVQVFDQDSGELRLTQDPVSPRDWLSIMVPTDAGWQLWRDQLIEPGDPELQTPDVPPPPGLGDQERTPEL